MVAQFLASSRPVSYTHLINRGRMLHTLFSVIETAEDIDPAIERLIFEGVIRNDEKEKVAREVATKAFSSPEIQDWYSGKWTLFNAVSYTHLFNIIQLLHNIGYFQ